MALGLAAAGGLCGTVLIVAGTFLPWVVSGGRGRNVYQLTGIADKLGLLDHGLARAVPGAVGLLGPACIAPVVLALVRWWRTAAVAAILCGLLAALPAAAALALGDRASAVGIHLDRTGPISVLGGGVLLLSAGVLTLFARLRMRWRAAGVAAGVTAGVTVAGAGRAGHSPGTGPTNGPESATASVTLDTAAATRGQPSMEEVRRWGRDADRRGEQ